MKCSYTLNDGHILFEMDGKTVLLDTGAPCSVGEGSLEFNGKVFDLQNNYLGLTMASLSDLAGFHIDILMGADLIGQHDLYIDSVYNTLEFSDNNIPDGQIIPLDVFMGIPVLDAYVNGENVKAFFDTGAKLSYVDQPTVNGQETIDQTEDFYPGVGKFHTDIYRLNTILGNNNPLELNYGVLPSILQMTLMMANVKGIIGTEILKHTSCLLSLKKKELVLVTN